MRMHIFFCSGATRPLRHRGHSGTRRKRRGLRCRAHPAQEKLHLQQRSRSSLFPAHCHRTRRLDPGASWRPIHVCLLSLRTANEPERTTSTPRTVLNHRSSGLANLLVNRLSAGLLFSRRSRPRRRRTGISSPDDVHRAFSACRSAPLFRADGMTPG